MRYQENHIIRFSYDKSAKAAKTVVAIMISPMMCAPPVFPCRLIPVYSLKHDLTFQQTQKVITLIHQNGSYTFFLMTDNLRENHACFKLYREIFGSIDIFSCEQPLENKEFENFTFYMILPITKKIFVITGRLKKMQKLKFIDLIINRKVKARWSDSIWNI